MRRLRSTSAAYQEAQLCVSRPPARRRALPRMSTAWVTAEGSSGCSSGIDAQARASRAGSAGSALRSPARGQATVSPALLQGVAVAMEASRARQSDNCCSQPGSGTASGASTATSASPQACSICSRCADSPIERGRRVYSACKRVRASHGSITACTRGPPCASSANQTGVPAGVAASSAARQASSATSSTPTGNRITGKGTRRPRCGVAWMVR